MKRLVLFVEGDGDASAVPKLLERLLTEVNAWDHLYLDPKPLVVRGLGRLLKNDCEKLDSLVGRRGETS